MIGVELRFPGHCLLNESISFLDVAVKPIDFMSRINRAYSRRRSLLFSELSGRIAAFADRRRSKRFA
jgi:hypothetical protein